MDKIYSEYVTYNGESSASFVYCTAANPTANCEGVLGGNLQPVDTNLTSQQPQPLSVEVALIPQKYEVQQKYGVHHKYQYVVPVEFKCEKNRNESSLAMIQPIVICQETQTTEENKTATQTQKLPDMKDTEIILHEQYYVDERREDVSFNVEEKDKNEYREMVESNITPNVTLEIKKKTRHKVADPKSWSSNVRKTKHQRGEAYINRRGKFVPERRIKNMKDCRDSCKLHCSKQLSDADRQHIFRAFYSLSSNEKKHFLLNTTERHSVKRPLKVGSNDEPKRKYTFKYFFLVRAIRYNVCKAFYLGTLAISQKPVYNVHMNKSDMNLPKPDGRGLAVTSSHSISEDRKQKVRQHINSFPAVDSNGSTNSNRRKYLDSGLSIKKMHLMYAEMCNREGLQPVKESMYRKIFKNDFNLHFKKEKVKVERCENCKHPIKKKCS